MHYPDFAQPLMSRLRPLLRSLLFTATATTTLMLAACGGGNGTPASDSPAAGFAIGSGNAAHAEPSVPRPLGKPCTVSLFADVTFNNFDSRPFDYRATCPGPWQKVVLEADFSVNAGRQFDRTGHISIAGVNIYTGTTQEPSATVGPNWHVERDLTDYAPLFVRAAGGFVDLDNLVNETYTGRLMGSARLVFYPLQSMAQPRVADMVLGLGSNADGRPSILRDSQTTISKTLTLPRNVVRAYLDVLAQGQSDDEFWWSCAPDDLTEPLQTCGATAFREAQVSIDGQLAGVAPVFPWIFTGGVNPRLWRPTPGVQTLNMKPHRVDLSPFAALLSDGLPHKVEVAVQNARNYFNVTASLLLFRDPLLPQVSGALVSNTLVAARAPLIDNRLGFSATGDVFGTIATTSRRQFAIIGSLQSSLGREELSVRQSMDFVNTQTFSPTLNDFVQTATVKTVSASATESGITAVERNFSFPFSFSIITDGSSMSSEHAAIETQRYTHRGATAFVSESINRVSATSQRSGTPAVNQSSATQYFSYTDDNGACYERRLSSKDGLLSAAIDGKRCAGKANDGKPFGRIASDVLDYWLVLGN
jgi:hypothetical protein